MLTRTRVNATSDPPLVPTSQLPALRAMGSVSMAIRENQRVKELSLWLILGFLGLAWAWLLPGHFIPWPGFRQEVLAGAAFVLCAGSAIANSQQIIWPRIALIGFVAACIPLLQLAVGQIDFRSGGVLSATYVAAFATSMSIGASLAASKQRLQLLNGFAACVVFAGIVSSGMAVCQWLGPSVWEGLLDPHTGTRPFANIGQPNHLSTQLLLGVVGVLYWYENRRVNGLPAALAIAWLGFGILLSESRTGWLSVVVLAGWWCLMRNRVSLRLRGFPLLVGILTFACAVPFLGHLHVLVGAVDPTAADALTLRVQAGTRPAHWLMLLDALHQSPWWGYGWNQVANAQFAVSAKHPGMAEWLTQSHNLVLDLLIYNGLPAGLLLCSVVLLWFVRHSWACTNSTTWCLLLGLFMLFTHALLENPLHFTYFLLPAGLLIGVLSSESRVEPSWSSRRWTLAVPTLLLVVPFALVSVEYLDAEESLRDMELSFKGVGTRPSDLPQHNWILLDGWAAYHRASTAIVSSAMTPQQLEELRKVVSRYPYPNVLMQYAHASALNSNPGAASKTLIHGCKVFGAATCDQMRKVWTRLQSIEPAVRSVKFPEAVG